MLSGVWLVPCHARSIRSPPTSSLWWVWNVRSGTGLAGSLSRASSRLVSMWPTRTTLRPNSAEVVGVVVRVDDVGHLVGHAVGRRDLVDGALQVVPDGGGRVEQHHPLFGGQESRLVAAVGDPVQVLLHPPDEVALRVDGRAQRGRRYRRVVRQRVGGCRFGEGFSDQGGDRGDGRERRATCKERAAVRG